MNYTIKKSIVLSLLLISCLTCKAQLEAHLIDGEGWAKGKYIEFGINERGVYGSNTDNIPSTFHENRVPGLFGFLANPAADGWVDYDGDYFTPGDPEEGFSVEIGGVNYSNNNVDELFQVSGGITGSSILESDCFDDVAQIIWEGNINGLSIRRSYSVTEEGLFIQMITTIKNTTSETKSDVYFMHNVDPDNNQSISGSYETNMNLISQASSVVDDVCLVTASQNGDAGSTDDPTGSNVSFFSNNPLARVSYGGFSNRSASDVWNAYGFTGSEGSTADSVDIAISIAFNLGDFSGGQEMSFVYYYILEEIDEDFIPLIVNITPRNPSTCNEDSGSILISGLVSNEDYMITYEDDGVTIPEESYTANADGIIEITNLNSGSYSNINLAYETCTSNISNTYVLTDPVVPEFSLTKTELTKCFVGDGTISLSNLLSDSEYNISYMLDGNLVNGTYTTNSSGEITISNLGEGVYSDFTAEIYNCYVFNGDVINLIEPENPIANTINTQFYCDEDYDYITIINLLELNDTVLGGQDPDDFEITYHLSESDMDNDITIPYTFETSGMPTFILYCKIKNIETGCYAYTLFNTIIGTPAHFDLNEAFICLNSDDTVNYNYDLPVIDTLLSPSLYSFEWFHDGVILPAATSSSLVANNFGEYSVTVTQNSSGCHITKSTIIHPSGVPNNFEVNIVSLPFLETNTVEIVATGYGDYQYKMENGDFQSSPIFSNVTPGYHVFYVNDINGCGVVYEGVFVIDYPKFFTPNGDGINDYWQIIGVEGLKNAKTFVFDRYGKLITTLNSSDIGWNGEYNGNVLPSSDYWFKVVYIDSDNIEREFTAHFSLKR